MARPFTARSSPEVPDQQQAPSRPRSRTWKERALSDLREKYDKMWRAMRDDALRAKAQLSPEEYALKKDSMYRDFMRRQKRMADQAAAEWAEQVRARYRWHLNAWDTKKRGETIESMERSGGLLGPLVKRSHELREAGVLADDDKFLWNEKAWCRYHGIPDPEEKAASEEYMRQWRPESAFLDVDQFAPSYEDVPHRIPSPWTSSSDSDSDGDSTRSVFNSPDPLPITPSPWHRMTGVREIPRKRSIPHIPHPAFRPPSPKPEPLLYMGPPRNTSPLSRDHAMEAQRSRVHASSVGRRPRAHSAFASAPPTASRAEPPSLVDPSHPISRAESHRPPPLARGPQARTTRGPVPIWIPTSKAEEKPKPPPASIPAARASTRSRQRASTVSGQPNVKVEKRAVAPVSVSPQISVVVNGKDVPAPPPTAESPEPRLDVHMDGTSATARTRNASLPPRPYPKPIPRRWRALENDQYRLPRTPPPIRSARPGGAKFAHRSDNDVGPQGTHYVSYSDTSSSSDDELPEPPSPVKERRAPPARVSSPPKRVLSPPARTSSPAVRASSPAVRKSPPRTSPPRFGSTLTPFSGTFSDAGTGSPLPPYSSRPVSVSVSELPPPYEERWATMMRASPQSGVRDLGQGMREMDEAYQRRSQLFDEEEQRRRRSKLDPVTFLAGQAWREKFMEARNFNFKMEAFTLAKRYDDALQMRLQLKKALEVEKDLRRKFEDLFHQWEARTGANGVRA